MNDDKAIMFAVHLIASKGDCYSATLNMGMTTHSCADCPWKEIGEQQTKELLTEVLL